MFVVVLFLLSCVVAIYLAVANCSFVLFLVAIAVGGVVVVAVVVAW